MLIMASPKFPFLFSFSILAFSFLCVPTFSLNIGVQLVPGFNVSKDCSRTCESEFCGSPFLRYGKYCGLLYSGCPGEVPCDGLDSCCKNHDECIAAKNDYLSQSCNKRLIQCVKDFQKRKGMTFKGNTCSLDDVVGIIHKAIDAAIFAGRIFHKP